MPRRFLLARGLVALGIGFILGASTAALGAITLLPFASGLAGPVEVTHAGDGSGRLFVLEQAGVVRVVRDGRVLDTPYLDVSALVEAGGERGLLGIAFHPQFRSNGRFFLNYTRRGDGDTVIAEYRADAPAADIADPASGATLLVVPQPFANHNGGTLRFGPDGFLYIGMGDGGSANDPNNFAQDPQSLLGKLLRIDVDHGTPYAIPAGNAFADASAGQPEIFALGLRNPWKFSFDRATGDLYIADVGQNAREEIDLLPAGQGAGANFGWRVMEGARCTGLGGGAPCASPTFTPAVVDYGRDLGCSITGGYVYRGSEAPTLVGRFVYADYCSGRFWATSRLPDGSWRVDPLLRRPNGPTSFGEDEGGEVYVADAKTGEVLRLVDDATPPDRVIEYYNPGLDHFFITRIPDEIAALDQGRLSGWVRTGRAFDAFGAGAGEPVCRFYLPPAVGDSHFYSVVAAECDAVRQRFPEFVLETTEAMRMMTPAAGQCPAGAVVVYRLWNGRADSNHRYTTDRALRDAMVARGFVAEGDGPDAVAMCAAAAS